MTRVCVFLSAALLAASLGLAAQDGARGQTNPTRSNAQVSQASPASSSPVKNQAAGQDPAQSLTTADRKKRIEGSDEGSENLVKNGAPLPQTSTILPLLGFIGLGSLVAGLFARR